jgi:hypothetical protein
VPLFPGRGDLGLDATVSGESRNEERSGETYALNLVLLEVGDLANDCPHERASVVDGFMHNERHDSGG